jgi:hypothetical protein
MLFFRYKFSDLTSIKNRGGNKMKCDRCSQTIEPGEAHEHFGRNFCEDCYMDALSPAKTCDPWAVHSAQSFAKSKGGALELNDFQKRILHVLKETGGAEPADIISKLGTNPADFEREVAALRHMEKLRGELRDGKKFLTLW